MNVLLVHGLGRTSASMWGLAHFLRSHQHQPHYFGYRAWKNSYAEIVTQLRSQIIHLASQGDYGIVAHSLGGLLSRSALQQAPRPQNLIMLGTPNQPPRLAHLANQFAIFQWLTQDCGQRLAQPHFFSTIPEPSYPYTLLAGTAGPTGILSPFGDDPNDGIVAVQETVVQLSDRPLLFPIYHTFMMNHRPLQHAILDQLNP